MAVEPGSSEHKIARVSSLARRSRANSLARAPGSSAPETWSVSCHLTEFGQGGVTYILTWHS